MPPTILLNSLQSVRRRVKILSVAFGAGIVVACAVGVVIATVFLDWLFERYVEREKEVGSGGPAGW